jgi:Zn-dependent membrane protease YugP
MSHPLAPSLYAASILHCMTVSLAYGGAGLGNMWGEQLARQMLAEAGFTSVDVRRVEGDYLNNYFVATLG